MKISVFFVENQFVSWSMSRGLVTTLKRMGHDVMPVVTPTAGEADHISIEMVKAGLPPMEILQKQDAILISGPEYLAPWFEHVYGMLEWKQMGVPKAGWLHESCEREDRSIDFSALAWAADEWFFPAIQDAEFHDQEMFAKERSHWMPFGVDTTVFKPADADSVCVGVTLFDVGFIGLMYPKRQIYAQALSKYEIPPIRIGNVRGLTDLMGYDYPGAAKLLASQYRRIKVFFNLPAMSQLLVSKVYEVMACGTFLVTPLLPTERGANNNLSLFETGKHLVYYRAGNLPAVVQALREWSSPDKDAERREIARAGCEIVHKNHSLEMRLTEILEKLRVKQTVN
jgi:hypothetical protein